MALYKRPNSKYWWMKFTFDGQLIQQSTQVANKRDAATIESAFRTQLALGKIGVRPKCKAPTFEQAADEFLAWSKINHAQKPNSFRRVGFSCQTLKNFFGKTSADKISKSDIEKFILWRSRQISKRTGTTITGTTINSELIVLKTIFKRLVSAKSLSENPASEVKQLVKNERRFHVLTQIEEKQYLIACTQPLQDVAALILETGMRPNEIFQMKRQNVNLDNGFVQIENGKTRSSNRKVWLSDKAIKILLHRLEKFNGDYLFPFNDIDEQKPTEKLTVQHLKAVRSLGYSFRLYDCRHTFATRVLDNGTDLLTLASMLGHSSLNEVMRYAHPSETLKNNAIQKMQRKEAKAV